MEDPSIDKSPYLREMIHPGDARTIELLTKDKNWTYAQFRQVLIALGIVGRGYAIPAANRPDSVDISGWTQDMNGLFSQTNTTGLEHGKIVFVDTDKKGLVMGRVSSGEERKVILDDTRQPGRELFQKPIADAHIHPNAVRNAFWAHGFSPPDYIAFISSPQIQASLVGFSNDSLMLAMKTSVTPNGLSVEDVKKRVNAAQEDYFDDVSKHPIFAVAEFNKAVCSEFGLVLFTGGVSTGNVLKRVDVTK